MRHAAAIAVLLLAARASRGSRICSVSGVQANSTRGGTSGYTVRVITEPGAVLDLESLFAYGLERLLDGLSTALAPRQPRRG